MIVTVLLGFNTRDGFTANAIENGEVEVYSTRKAAREAGRVLIREWGHTPDEVDDGNDVMLDEKGIIVTLDCDVEPKEER